MNLEKYTLKSTPDLNSFEFISEGIQGNIEKIVMYNRFTDQILPIYNLGFGDKNPQTGELSDTIKTNNGDRDKVLATVASTVYEFTERYSNAWVFMQGSTPIRTRLYQMGINLYYDEIVTEFKILGLQKDDWFDFEKNTNYDAFLVTRKQNT